MSTTIRYILITALRDWLFLGLFIAVFCAFGISMFLGNTALVEEGQMKIAYVAGSTRIILVLGIFTFVCFHVRNAFNNKEIELMLSRPISRTAFVFAYWLGFSAIAVILVTALVIAMSFLHSDFEGLLYWGLSIILENLLIIAFAIFSSLILKSAVSSVLLCSGFYLVSRMMGFLLYIVESPHLFSNFEFGIITGKLLVVFSAILPRLDLFGKSEWLIYGIADDNSYLWFLGQSLIYIPFLLIMAALDFKRKQF